MYRRAVRIWLAALATFALGCGSTTTEQAPARKEQPGETKPAASSAHRRELLARFEVAVKKASPTLAARLRPGATGAQIAAFETYVTALEAGVLHKASDADAIIDDNKVGDEGPGHAKWEAFHAAHNPGYPKRLRAVGGH